MATARWKTPALVDHLARTGMTLTSCPLSNLALCVIEDVADSPVKDMLAAGLNVTVNSDDPAYFGGYLNANYLAIAKAQHLKRGEIITLARNSFTGSFLPPTEVARHLNAIDQAVSA